MVLGRSFRLVGQLGDLAGAGREQDNRVGLVEVGSHTAVGRHTLEPGKLGMHGHSGCNLVVVPAQVVWLGRCIGQEVVHMPPQADMLDSPALAVGGKLEGSQQELELEREWAGSCLQEGRKLKHCSREQVLVQPVQPVQTVQTGDRLVAEVDSRSTVDNNHSRDLAEMEGRLGEVAASNSRQLELGRLLRGVQQEEHHQLVEPPVFLDRSFAAAGMRKPVGHSLEGTLPKSDKLDSWVDTT